MLTGLPVRSTETLEDAETEAWISTRAVDLIGEPIAPSTTDSTYQPVDLIPGFEPFPSTERIDSPTFSFSTLSLPELEAASIVPAQTPPDSSLASTPTPVPTPAAGSTSAPEPDRSLPDDSYAPNANLRLSPNLGEGRPIERVYIYLTNLTEDAEQNEAFQQQIADAFSIQAGGSFSPLFADRGVNQVQQLPFVQLAEYQLYDSELPGAVVVALLVTLQPEEAGAPPVPQPARGIVVSGDIRDFPTLYEDDRSLFKFILNGGAAVFSDTDAWFGNPQAFVSGDYQLNGTITWPEFYLEPGLAGITRLGDSPAYLYGAASYTVSGTLAPDIFRDDTRTYGDIEQLYGGLLIAELDSPIALNLSGGRQRFQLNQGFLFSQFSGSANALERAASFSNPRVAYETTILANIRLGDVRLQGFFLQPNELPISDSETQYLGASLSYNNTRNLEAVLSYITVPQSSRLYILPGGETAGREGLQVINPRIRLSSLFGVDGLWAESEYAYEFSDELNMSAQGGYIWLGYTAQNVSWRPGISYRFAGFSGDNPNTAAYERFDPLQSGGLSDWLQGINLGKVYNNSNGWSHRVTLSIHPSDSLSLSLDYYYRFADLLNNLGGNPALQTLQSRDIGHEILFTGQYFLSQNFLLQGVTSIAFPGEAIRQALPEEAKPWYTLQVSLFMFF